MLVLARREPSAILLAAQLGALLLYPFMESSDVGRALFSILGIAFLGLVVLAVRSSPGLTWVGIVLGAPATVLLLIQAIYPESFTAAVAPAADRTWMELLFLSFTTLSSTGLSDIVPITSWGRSVVMLEQLAGLGYVAMVVSRLVGLTITKRTNT